MSSVRAQEAALDEQLYPEAEIRAIYEQFDLGSGHVGMLSDPENEYAWIQSNVTVPVEA